LESWLEILIKETTPTAKGRDRSIAVVAFDFSVVAALAEVSAMVHVVDRTGFLRLGDRGNGHEPNPKRYKVS
jgi:hypothetical protein